jgi:serine/threonine-protein kinase
MNGTDMSELTSDPDATLPPADGVVVNAASQLPTAEWSLRQFGGYELLGELARGGMGVVYRARQVSLNRMVALKMILAGQLASEGDVRRFRAEAEAAAGLDHPNVLPIYEVGEHHGQLFFSMKLVEGGCLADRVGDLVGKPEAVADLVLTLARAVEAAHRHGVVHRDLKPANILLDADGTAYITDFGLAKRTGTDDCLTKTGAILGTPAYMAPEQARGERHVGSAVDVYALGAILYELLTGVPPFRGPTPLDTILEVMEREPTPPRSVRSTADSDLGRIALKCLEKVPAKRYASAQALADDLERWRAGEPIVAKRPRWTERLRGWARREPGLACRLAMIGIVAAVVHLKFRLEPAVAADHHLRILVLLAGWAVVSIVCQWLLRRDRYATGVVTAWLIADASFLTGLLTLDASHESPLVVIYGLYVAASGVWLRVQLVWLCTAAAVAGYAALVGVAAARGALAAGLHLHAIVAIALVATGAVVAFQVRRAKQLSRFAGSK